MTGTTTGIVEDDLSELNKKIAFHEKERDDYQRTITQAREHKAWHEDQLRQLRQKRNDRYRHMTIKQMIMEKLSGGPHDK